MSAFTYTPKPKRNAEPKTCEKRILFFLFSVPEIQQIQQEILIKNCIHTATWVVYNLVIMKSLMDCLARQLCGIFYKHDTTDCRLLWDKTQSNYKADELKAVAWNNLYCKGISAI